MSHEITMNLFYSPTSPYVRKVMASAHLLGLERNIKLLPSTANPIARDMVVSIHNPLGKVPTAFLEDGTHLIDSRTICEYLHLLAPEAELFPVDRAIYWQALQIHAIGDGILDTALLARYETAVRPQQLHWQDWLNGLLGKIDAAVEALENSVQNLLGRTDIGSLTVGCALGYLDFRLATLDWRRSAPKLAVWWEDFAETAPMKETWPAG